MDKLVDICENGQTEGFVHIYTGFTHCIHVFLKCYPQVINRVWITLWGLNTVHIYVDNYFYFFKKVFKVSDLPILRHIL